MARGPAGGTSGGQTTRPQKSTIICLSRQLPPLGHLKCAGPCSTKVIEQRPAMESPGKAQERQEVDRLPFEAVRCTQNSGSRSGTKKRNEAFAVRKLHTLPLSQSTN